MILRLMCLILVVFLLLLTGCSRTVSTVQPELYQNPGLSLPCEVQVTLKGKTLLQGTYRGNATTWQTDRLWGKVLAWNDEEILVQTVIEVPGLPREFRVPIEDIDRIEVIHKVHPALATAGLLMGVVALFFYYLRALLSSD